MDGRRGRHQHPAPAGRQRAHHRRHHPPPDHQEYEKFDPVVILGRGGKLLFFGPPSPDSYGFFGATPGKPREMFDHLEQLPPDPVAREVPADGDVPALRRRARRQRPGGERRRAPSRDHDRPCVSSRSCSAGA
ncbi:MAG: hypothetical protein M5U28_06915 [Sandaracinaceae bacterium]|nr:hypothetical protein [Sandaracinaceae bacterium]